MIDKYHTHEALDRTHLASAFIQENLVEHPFITAHPEIKAKVNEAVAALEAAYQMVGAISAKEKRGG